MDFRLRVQTDQKVVVFPVAPIQNDLLVGLKLGPGKEVEVAAPARRKAGVPDA
jgi:hypothetical protein